MSPRARASSLLVALGLALAPSVSVADPAAVKEAQLALQVKLAQERVDAAKEASLQAKARWLLFRTAVVSTASLAQSPKEAVAHAAKAAPATPVEPVAETPVRLQRAPRVPPARETPEPGPSSSSGGSGARGKLEDDAEPAPAVSR